MNLARVDSSHPQDVLLSTDGSVVFVVDDDIGIRESISFEMESVGLKVKTFASAPEFLEAYDPAMPGCLILDVRMQKMSGLELQDILNERGILLPVIIISGHADVGMAVRAMKANAMDFLQKPVSGQTLLDLVNKALIADAERRAKANKGDNVNRRMATLTRREREVLTHVLNGKISTEIAESLGISYKTIEAHRANINRKMNAKNVAQLISLINEAT